MQFKLVMYTCWVSVQNWFTFWLRWPNFGPLMAKKNQLKMGQNVGFRSLSEKSIHTIQFKLVVYTCWVSVQNWFAFGPCWPSFGPLVATKWLKMEVSDHYLKKYSCNSIQTWCVHLLGECSELIRSWTTLAKFWPSSSHKMTENCGFHLSSEQVILQSNSNLVCTFIVWVFSIYSLLGHVDQIFALLWLKNEWNWVKMGVSNHHQLNYPLNPIDSRCAHLFGESSEIIPFFCRIGLI